MPVVRCAEPSDFLEILGYAHRLWADMDLPVAGCEWESNAEQFFAKSLVDGTLNAFVADHP